MKNSFLFLLSMMMLVQAHSQNVGINTTTPTAPLDVRGTGSYVAAFYGAAPMYMGLWENNIYRGYIGSYSGNPEDVDFGTGTGNTGKLHLTITGSPKLTIDNAGNVGVGTTSPSAKFQVNSGSTSSFNNAFMIKNSNGDTLFRMRDNGTVGIGYNGFSYGRMLNIEGNGINLYYDQSTFGGSIFPDVNNNMVLWSNSSGPGQNVVLQPSWGQVTVGTYTPAAGYKVSVKGKVMCEELKVQLSGSWPDYVFDSKYALLPLDQLEKKVMEDKHLPGILPAHEVEASKGFEIGDMQKRLLEKVEELYRYVFELNRENKSLRSELEVLKSR